MVEAKNNEKSEKEGGEFDIKEAFKNPTKLLATVRNMIVKGQIDGPKTFIEMGVLELNVVMSSQLMHASIFAKQNEMVKYLIEKGCDLNTPPQQVQPLGDYPDLHEKYQQAPYIIQAACAGNLDVVKTLVKAGCSVNELGHICISKRRLNLVASNCVGAAAYHGHADILKYCLAKMDAACVDLQAAETSDRVQSKSSGMKPEYQNFTPLQLCIVSPNCQPECVKLLFGADSNHLVKEVGTENNIVHLAAKYCAKPQVLKYVVKNAKVDIFSRNKDGDTALTLAQTFNTPEAAKIIEECWQDFDKTGQKTDELLDELMGQEEKEERAKQKRKEKKHRSKLQKLAEKHGCTIEQLEQVFKEQEDKKKQEEKDRELAIQQAEREAELKAQRERQARIAEIERQREEELEEIAAQEAEERKIQAAERAKRSAARAQQQLKLQQEEKNRIDAKQTDQPKLNKKQQKTRDYQERKRLEEQDKAAEDAEVDGDNETPSGETPTPAAPADDSKGPKVLGLTGELAIQKAGKKARRALLEEQKREEAERLALKERIQKANLERDALRVQQKKDAQKQEREAKKRQQDEEKRAIEATQEAEKEAARLAKLQKKREKAAEKRAAAKAAASANVVEDENTPTPGAAEATGESAEASATPQPKEKASKKEKRKGAADSEKPQEPAKAQQEIAADAASTPKQPKEKRSKKGDKAASKEQAAPQMVYQPKKKADASSEQKESETATAQPSQQSVAAEEHKQAQPVVPADSDSKIASVLAELKQLKNELSQANKAKTKSEKRAEKLSQDLAAQSAQNQKLEEIILELEQEGTLQTSSSERHLVKQNKQLNDQLQQQITVNKTLSSKLMISQKAFIDEKRARFDVEKRLSTALSSQPPAGPQESNTERKARGGQDATSLDDLRQMQYSLANVNQRMQQSLLQQQHQQM